MDVSFLWIFSWEFIHYIKHYIESYTVQCKKINENPSNLCHHQKKNFKQASPNILLLSSFYSFADFYSAKLQYTFSFRKLLSSKKFISNSDYYCTYYVTYSMHGLCVKLYISNCAIFKFFSGVGFVWFDQIQLELIAKLRGMSTISFCILKLISV